MKLQNHLCSNHGGWRICTACQGRLHQPECTSRKNKHKDCCPARHKMLHDQGQTRGIDDDSVTMWKEQPTRFIVRDVRLGQYTGFRKIREPWQVIDTKTSAIVDELHSKRAATMEANALNKGQ